MVIGDLTSRYKDKIGPALEGVEKIVIHRVGVNDRYGIKWDDDPKAICDKFITDKDVGKYTGFKVPYHFIVNSHGMVGQCIPLSRQGSHAKSHNRNSIAIAAYGDFRTDEPSYVQVLTMRSLVEYLQIRFGVTADNVVGHSDLNGGSTDPLKECPGIYMDLRCVTSGCVPLSVVT